MHKLLIKTDKNKNTIWRESLKKTIAQLKKKLSEASALNKNVFSVNLTN